MRIRLVEILICVAIVCALCYLMNGPSIAIADGSFRLSITSDTTRQLPSDLWIAYCWNQDEMKQAVAGGTQEGVIFRPAFPNVEGVIVVELPHISKRETGQKDSYNEPKFIVVQFHSAGQTQRDSFPIPEGRGDREVRVRLDH